MMHSKTIVLRALLFLILCPVILALLGSITRATSTLPGTILVGSIASLLTFLLTLLFVRWDGLDLHAVGAALSAHSMPRLLSGFIVGLALVAFQDLLIYSGRHAHWVSVRPHPTAGYILLALAAYSLVAVREELAFRGYPLRRLEHPWGIWLALLLTAAAFVLEHKVSGWTWPHALLGPSAGALLFGMAALATRGLAVPIGIHAAFNFGQWMMGQKEIPGLWQPIVDAGYAHQTEVLGYIGYLAGTLLATFAFWVLRNRYTCSRLAPSQLVPAGIHR